MSKLLNSSKATVAKLQKEFDQLKQTLDTKKVQLDSARGLMLQEMLKEGIKSIEMPGYLAVRSVRTDIEVTSEKDAIEWLKANDQDLDLFVGLKKEYFKPLARVALRQDGEIPGGCEVTRTDILTLRKENK